MDMRELKGLEIAARCKITLKDGAWVIPSQSGNGTYAVILSTAGDHCTCEDFGLTGKACKHIFAARIVRERDHGGAAVPLDTDVASKRPTYPQNWPAYNLAQTTEKHRLQVLLADLCAGVPEPPPAKTGRKPIPIADRIFAAAFKVYSTVSTRRFNCDLQDAHERGHLSRPLHCNKVNCFMADPELTPALKQLVAQSALPQRSIEGTSPWTAAASARRSLFAGTTRSTAWSGRATIG
jgi:hypothetical protein